jgi:hypothetical protein
VLRRAALSQLADPDRDAARERVQERRLDRSRARIDDDLFDGPLNAAGGRR